MPLEVVGHFALQVLARLRPLFEEAVQLLDVDEEMIGRTEYRRRTRQSTHGIDQVGRTVRVAALVAAIAVLIGSLTFRIWTRSLHESVGQKRPRDRIEQLRDRLFVDEAPCRSADQISWQSFRFASLFVLP